MTLRFSRILAASLALALTACGHAPIAAAPRVATAATVQSLPDLGNVTIPQALRDEAAAGQRLANKPLAYSSQAEEDAYLASLTQGLPQSVFDKQGFLAKLGVADAVTPGKQDAPTFAAVLQIKNYRPGTLVNGREIMPQVVAFNVAAAHPQFFLGIINASNYSVEALSAHRSLWTAPFKCATPATPSADSAREHYAMAIAKLTRYHVAFDEDFHSGIPSDDLDDATYGTYSTCIGMGFTETQARRIAINCNGVDMDTTPYGKTSFSPTGQLDRHFNLEDNGEDTRLVWAQRHLDAARLLAATNAYDAAEVELGCGLHSLQDCFAHGQLTPSMHGVIGEFPDQVSWDPVALVEATRATIAYIQLYLGPLGQAAQPQAPTGAAAPAVMPSIP